MNLLNNMLTIDWVLIGALVAFLVVLIIVFVICFGKKHKKDTMEANNIAQAETTEETAATQEPTEVETQPEEVETTEEKVETTEEEVETTEEEVETTEEEEEVEEPTTKTPAKTTKKTTTGKKKSKYIVVYDREIKKWCVKKEGAARVIRKVKTKEEALQIAKSLRVSQDSTLQVHKKDGKFQKQK